MDSPTKVCPKCKKEKHRDEFGYNKRAWGLATNTYCKPCMSARQKTPEVKAKRKEMLARDDIKQKAADCQRRRRQTEEYKASRKLRMGEENRRAREKHGDRNRRLSNDWKRNNRGSVLDYNARRKAGIARATPIWSDKSATKVLYEKANELSKRYGVELQVDHIVPLNSPIVCGLHVPANLQLLEARLNREKKNVTWPDMPD